MEKLKKALDAVPYAIAVFIILFLAAMVFGLEKQFGELFSLAGFFAMAFLVFTVIAE